MQRNSFDMERDSHFRLQATIWVEELWPNVPRAALHNVEEFRIEVSLWLSDEAG